MRKLLMASVISLTVVTGFGQSSNAALTYPDCTGPGAKIYYYDCDTGAWCGSTDIYCNADPSHVGCETTCSKFVRAACNCPPPQE
jgi:hypothetical protein